MEQNNILMNKQVRNLVVVFLVCVSFFLFAQAISVINTWDDRSAMDPIPQITVSGKGEVLAVPDISTFSFSVIEDGKTVKEAQDLATAKTNKAVKFLKDSKIDEKDIKTTDYSISPKYEYQSVTCVRYPCPSGKQVLLGYTVSQSISVKVRDVAKSGTLLSGIGGIEVQNVSGLNFTIDDEEALNESAREKAIADAKSKASKLTSDLGVRIVRIVSFSENGFNPLYYGKGGGMMANSMDSASPAPEVPIGQNTITSNVSITYEVR